MGFKVSICQYSHTIAPLGPSDGVEHKVIFQSLLSVFPSSFLSFFLFYFSFAFLLHHFAMCDMVLTLTLFLRSHEPLHSCACMLERNILSKATEFAPGVQIRLVDRITSGGERRMFVHTWGFNQSLLSTFHHFCSDYFEGVVCGIFF